MLSPSLSFAGQAQVRPHHRRCLCRLCQECEEATLPDGPNANYTDRGTHLEPQYEVLIKVYIHNVENKGAQRPVARHGLEQASLFLGSRFVRGRRGWQ